MSYHSHRIPGNFCTRSPSPPNWNSWNKIKKTIDVQNWTVHDTRRFFSTTLASLGIEPHIIERLLNHKSGEISDVAAIYNRFKYAPQMRTALQLEVVSVV